MTATVPFTSPGDEDTYIATWLWNDGVGDNWNNGTTSDGTVSASYDVTNLMNSGSVTGTHSFTYPGVYISCVTMSPSDNNPYSSLRCYNYNDSDSYLVVYDPSAGYVTANGSYDSPSTNGPDGILNGGLPVGGKAIVGVSVKYLGGQTPTGKVRFNFPKANINFESTSFDWFVFANGGAWLHGTGTVNGAGSHTFNLALKDGSTTGGQKMVGFQIDNQTPDGDYQSAIYSAGLYWYDGQMSCTSLLAVLNDFFQDAISNVV